MAGPGGGSRRDPRSYDSNESCEFGNYGPRVHTSGHCSVLGSMPTGDSTLVGCGIEAP